MKQNRKQREFSRREQEILENALQLFDSDSWESVTIEQIAQETDIGKGTVYKHFPGKDHIYARLALEFYDELLKRMKEIPPGQGIETHLRLMIHRAFEFHLERPQYRRVTQYCHRDDFRARVGESVYQDFRMLDERFTELTLSLIQRGIDEGVFPMRTIESSAYGLHATFEGAMHMLWCAESRQINIEAFIDEIIDFMIAGLKYRPSEQLSK